MKAKAETLHEGLKGAELSNTTPSDAIQGVKVIKAMLCVMLPAGSGSIGVVTDFLVLLDCSVGIKEQNIGGTPIFRLWLSYL